MFTYLRYLFLLLAVTLFSACEFLNDLDFLPIKPDESPADSEFCSVRGDFDGFDEFIYSDDTFICYNESDAGLPESMLIYTKDGDEEIIEMVYFNDNGIPEYYNINGESVYVENIRGELCDLLILNDDGTFTTIPDVETGIDINNYWSQSAVTRATGSNVANGVNMANRVLGARYFAEGSFDMGLGAYAMLAGCAMLVPGCNVVVGAALLIGGAAGFISGAIKVARSTDLLISDGTHTDGNYIGATDALDVVGTISSGIAGRGGLAVVDLMINSGFGAVNDSFDRRAQEQERLNQTKVVQSIKLTTDGADVDYCNRSVRLSGSLSSVVSPDDRVGILISDDPSALNVVDCYDKVASVGNFEFEFVGVERCKSYYYRSYYYSASDERSYVSKRGEFYVPGVKTGEYTELSDGRYEVALHAMLGDKIGSAEVGICYSYGGGSMPTIEDYTTDTLDISSSDIYTFTIDCEELPCFYRAFMIIEEGIIYDKEIFVVRAETEGCDDANHPHAVDLGLSVKWACCNVGANSPEEYGDYFAWGETSPKSCYTPENYQHWVGYYDCGVWCIEYVTLNSDISGTQYDAATANWGGAWRMPTYSELNELKSSCTWEWTTLNGVDGQRVTGPNGNSIFLPAAGWRDGSSSVSVGSIGFYWSPTPNEYFDDYAYGLWFDSGYYDWLWYDRYYGRSVRPVLE